MAESVTVTTADVGVLGAGPGGMAAAIACAEAGLSVVVLDEGARPGGQIFRQLPVGTTPAPHPEPPSHVQGHRLIGRLAAVAERLSVVERATVWDLTVGCMRFEKAGRPHELRCAKIVLAPGAYDRCVPFPGWTLPGVVTAGAAQVMVRGHGVRPGNRALVCGSGPLLLPTVTALLSSGVEVVPAREAAPRRAMLQAMSGVLRSGARIREALFYARQMLRHATRVRFGQAVFAVEGDGKVERAVVGRLDADGRPLQRTARTLEVDVVCAGFGLVPSIEAGLLLGCNSIHDEVRGGWRLQTDEFARTNVHDVHAVGEIAGIGGAEVAIAEGRAAAAAIVAERNGQAPDPRLGRAAAAQRRAADAMLRAFRPRQGWVDLCSPDTVVCRCEDVTAAEARAAAELHGASARAIKVGCRAGMGPCQARICGPNLQALVAPGSPMDRPVVQVPLKPVRTSTLLGTAEPDATAVEVGPS
jgi:thioredoxin reductase